MVGSEGWEHDGSGFLGKLLFSGMNTIDIAHKRWMDGIAAQRLAALAHGFDLWHGKGMDSSGRTQPGQYCGVRISLGESVSLAPPRWTRVPKPIISEPGGKEICLAGISPVGVFVRGSVFARRWL